MNTEWCSCVIAEYHPSGWFNDHPERTCLDYGHFNADLNCTRCKGGGITGQYDTETKTWYGIVRPLLDAQRTRNVVVDPFQSQDELKKFFAGKEWNEEEKQKLHLKKTLFEPNAFAEVVVEPEPHICIYCRQPVKQGRCGCV